MKKAFMVALFVSSTSIFSAEAGFNIEVNGETSAGITPKITVNRLASMDAIQALDGLPDLYTPLGLSGNISLGYKDASQANVNIQPYHSMEQIFNQMLIACGGSAGAPFPPVMNGPSQPMVKSAPSYGLDFILAKSEINDASQWVFSMQAQQTGLSLFMDASTLSGYQASVNFQDGTSKVITSDIFPTVSNKDVSAQFTIDGLSKPIETPVNCYSIGDGAVRFVFNSAK